MAMNRKAKTKIMQPKHVVGCFAVKKRANPWMFERVEWLNWRGKKLGNRDQRWLIFRCNNPDCPALLYITESEITRITGKL